MKLSIVVLFFAVLLAASLVHEAQAQCRRTKCHPHSARNECEGDEYVGNWGYCWGVAGKWESCCKKQSNMELNNLPQNEDMDSKTLPAEEQNILDDVHGQAQCRKTRCDIDSKCNDDEYVGSWGYCMGISGKWLNCCKKTQIPQNVDMDLKALQNGEENILEVYGFLRPKVLKPSKPLPQSLTSEKEKFWLQTKVHCCACPVGHCRCCSAIGVGMCCDFNADKNNAETVKETLNETF